MDSGKVVAAEIQLYNNAGMSLDLSAAVRTALISYVEHLSCWKYVVDAENSLWKKIFFLNFQIV